VVIKSSYCKGENHNVRGCVLKKAGINPEDYVTKDSVPPMSTEYGVVPVFQVLQLNV
jgi:hypothetical protein